MVPGPRPLSDFLAEWSQQDHDAQTQLRLLGFPDTYIAVMPDDMLAMEELYQLDKAWQTRRNARGARGARSGRS